MLPRGNDEYLYGEALSIRGHLRQPAIIIRIAYLEVDNAVVFSLAYYYTELTYQPYTPFNRVAP